MINHDFLGKTTIALDTESKGHQNFPITGRFITDMDGQQAATVGIGQKRRVRLNASRKLLRDSQGV
jgi:hypothetical protein